MKKMFLLFWVLTCAIGAYSQCDVRNNNREDGVQVRYTLPVRVGYDDDILFMIGLQTDGRSYYVNTGAMYKSVAYKANGAMTIRFKNGQSIQLEPIFTDLTKLKGFYTCSSLFPLTTAQLSKIKTLVLDKIIYSDESNIKHVIQIQTNGSSLITHYKCLSN